MVFRLKPKLPVGAYRTFAIKQPLRTHWRRATCAEVACIRYVNGWTAVLHVADPDEMVAADWIRARSDRRYVEVVSAPGEWTFTFEPGQTCFRAAEHRIPIGRPAIMLRRNGDWRGDLGGLLVHAKPEDWRDDLAEQLSVMTDAKQRG